jgi:hypothetical protein
MGKRLRIDFVIREVDDPNGHGISFGDEVNAEDLCDFFDRCRDAARTLYNARASKKEWQKLEDEVNQLRTKAQASNRPQMGAAQVKRDLWDKKISHSGFMDDGSRGGDGPPSPEYLLAIKASERKGGPGEW